LGFYSFYIFQLHQGNRTNLNRFRETEEAIPYSHETEDLFPNSEIDSSSSSSYHPNNSQVPSQTTDTTSLNSAQASEYEDAESGRLLYLPQFMIDSKLLMLLHREDFIWI
jgi:cytoskeletal protein RodZ